MFKYLFKTVMTHIVRFAARSAPPGPAPRSDPQCASAQRFGSKIVTFHEGKVMFMAILRILTSWKMTDFSLIMEVHEDPREASGKLPGGL